MPGPMPETWIDSTVSEGRRLSIDPAPGRPGEIRIQIVDRAKALAIYVPAEALAAAVLAAPECAHARAARALAETTTHTAQSLAEVMDALAVAADAAAGAAEPMCVCAALPWRQFWGPRPTPHPDCPAHRISADACPACGSPDHFTVRPPCSLDQFDPDPWHRTLAPAADRGGSDD